MESTVGVRASGARGATALRHVAGLAELTSHLGSEIVALVQEVHAASSPVARLGADGLARGVYGGIRLGFTGARRVAAMSSRLTRHEPHPDTWLDVQSALNGAFGHLYEETSSGYALPMSLQRAAPARDRVPRLVVFLHGLCMNERGWQRPEHLRFREWATARLGADVAYVRYNTGLRISTSGARLAALLEGQTTAPELILVGHSMGGLVARSALHQAEEAGLSWPRRVSRLACLGSPHEGAHLERLGNHANRMLGASPFTRPFMRLGNLRSDGIRDLRFGHLIESDWQGRSPDDPRPAPSRVGLAGHVDHLHVAAARSERRRPDPLGDWLVPVQSALATTLHPADAVQRVLFRGMHHFDLLGDARVYDVLRRFIEAGR